MNIFLIGMMGSGKSSVGQSLSKYLNNTFYDLDKEIEKSFNLSIKDIFLEYGEDLFRKEEEKLLGELDKLSGLIVSTGGGIVISNVNRTILKKNKLSSENIISILAKINNKIKSVMIIGHNPGFTDLVNSLTNINLFNLPTTGIVMINVNIKNWSEISKKNKNEISWIKFPKELKS